MTPAEFRKILEEATPGAWKYDWGNWDVEGPHPDRYTVCSMTPQDREPQFPDQENNPVDSPRDGELIAFMRNHAEAFLELWEAVSDYQTGVYDVSMIRIWNALHALQQSK